MNRKRMASDLVRGLATCLAKIYADRELVSSEHFLRQMGFAGDRVMISVKVTRVYDPERFLPE